MYFLVTCLVASGVIGLGVIWSQRHHKLIEEAAEWPTTEATIQQTEIQEFGATSKNDVVHLYPCFKFSYVVDGEYYSGNFGLAVEGEAADKLVHEWTDKKVIVCYRPVKPSEYYLPDELMEGFEVLQKLSARGNPSPRD